MKNVLILDDEIDMALALKESLKRCGFAPVVCHNPVTALSELNLSDFELIITDMKMPKMDGIEFLQEIRKKGLFTPVIVITGYGTVENAVDAMKLGATDYIMKPFPFESLQRVIARIMPSEETDMVAESQSMKNLLAIVRDVAKADITVLITGESGTGKEIIARKIHKSSLRADKAFVAINCAAISENLLESELFGYEKGAFTGATERRIGKFELANKGTLLLDEISEMAYPLQAKLLRAIQEREIDRVGGKAPIPVDVRIIATTNRDLMSEVKAGRFREDLYYRLNVFPIKIPALRERRDDIAPLADFFVRRLSKKMGRVFELSDELKKHLVSRNWEGNVRELENFAYRLAVVSKSDLLMPLLYDEVSGITNTGKPSVVENAPKGTIKDMERDLVVKTLRETNGNRTRAAEALGVTVRTIRNKLKEYGITEEEIGG
ncbi:MAG: sigma-54-dependent Fis family transcriptional regulator [Nitrospirae bacterium]|nr:MAG: sigma-54-dependent Fis family transcriptional regulator [Nitrospirota bacterium]